MEEEGIKAVTIHDIEKIVDLRVSIFREIGKIASTEEEQSMKVINRSYLEKLSYKDCFCGFYEEVEGRIIAIALGVIMAFPPINLENQGMKGYIFNVYTDKDYRNQGKATQLTKKLVEELKNRGVNKIELDANENSFKIYEKIGFKLSGNHMFL